MNVTKTYEASLKFLPALMEWVQSCVGTLNIPLHQMQLALEETFVNIVQYSYGDQHGSVTITFHHVPGKEVTWEIRDQGKPFDPTKYRKKEKAPIGGYGIMLIYKLMSGVKYRREGEENILTLIRKLD